MLREAKKTLRVDKVPGVGSVFYTTRTGGGHVGFVSKVEDNLF
jgi:surface antigen